MHCSTAMINDVSVPWSNSLKYLGIVFVSGNKMTFDFKLSRSKFFRSFNSIYSKISKANETVIVSLIKTNCIPILIYGVEALDLKKSMLHSLNNVLCLVFGKIFGSYEKRILNNCLYYMNTLPLSFEYLIRKFRFLSKLKQAKSILLCKIHEIIGKAELLKLHSDLQLQPISNVAVVKESICMKFVNTLHEL